jgi:1-acyl-sn-glycerol-3-phosphate acyltransferase
VRDLTYPPIVVACKAAFKVMGWSFQLTGTENVPRTGGAVLACNHISYVDFIFGGYGAQPRLVRYMAKKETFDHRLTGPLMRSLHHIPVDRAAGIASYHQAVDYLRRGEVVGVFPEATISRSMGLKEFKTGTVRMAAEADVPLVPMVLWGTQIMYTKDHERHFPRKHTIGIHIGEPLHPSGDAREDTVRLKARMQALLDRAIEEYPLSPEGQWWAPQSHGGTAPSPEEAKDLDRSEQLARARRRAAKARAR